MGEDGMGETIIALLLSIGVAMRQKFKQNKIHISRHGILFSNSKGI